MRNFLKESDIVPRSLANGLMSFLVFEGIDGSGKSTLIRLLYEHLISKGLDALVTREPGGTELGDQLREIIIRTTGPTPVPRCELLLYEAIRAQHVEKVIRPALKLNQWVLCDRFTSSTIAFQSAGRGLDEKDIIWLNDFASDGLKPNKIILLDLSIQESFKRMQKRFNEKGTLPDRFEQEKSAFHQSVRDSYLKQARLDPNRWVVLDAELPSYELLESLLIILRREQWLD